MNTQLEQIYQWYVYLSNYLINNYSWIYVFIVFIVQQVRTFILLLPASCCLQFPDPSLFDHYSI